MNITYEDVYEYWYEYKLPWSNFSKEDKDFYIDSIEKIVISDNIEIFYYVYPKEVIGIKDYKIFLNNRRKNKLKSIIMEDLTTIVKNTTAKLIHVCSGKVIYHIETAEHKYQLEINSLNEEFETTYLLPEFKAITLMRWIRAGQKDGTFIQLF